MKHFLYLFFKWTNERTQRQKILLTILGLMVIYFSWNNFLIEPLQKDRQTLKAGIASAQVQIQIVNDQIAIIDREASEAAKRAEEAKNLPKEKVVFLKFTTAEGFNKLTREILLKQGSVNFIDLNKKLVDGKFTIQIQFRSGYLAAINYLQRLESLPWCLSWDSLDYKVLTYPEADVVVTLHAITV